MPMKPQGVTDSDPMSIKQDKNNRPSDEGKQINSVDDGDWQMHWPAPKLKADNRIPEEDRRELKDLKSDLQGMSFQQIQNLDFNSYQKESAVAIPSAEKSSSESSVHQSNRQVVNPS